MLASSFLFTSIIVGCEREHLAAWYQYKWQVVGHLKGSLSTRVFETRTATGREHFACQDRIVPQIFILLISNGEKILSNLNVVE